MPIRRPGGLSEEACTRSIISAFFEVYNVFGFGLLESAYREALALELEQRGHVVAREVSIRVFYKGQPIAWQRVDLLVDNPVIAEIKSTAKLPSIAVRQLYSYLHATRIEVGLLLHFGPEAKFYRLFSPNEFGEPASRADVEGNADKGSVVLSDRSD
jgi:GxxExxY protein